MITKILCWWQNEDNKKGIIFNWWFGNKGCYNPRLDPIVKDILELSDTSPFIIGGYVRGKFHEDKVASDLDVVVPDEVFDSASRLLKSKYGCEKLSPYNSDWYETWRIRPEGYDRFSCTKGVTVDLFTKSSYEENKKSIPTDIHHIRIERYDYDVSGIRPLICKSADEEQFPSDVLLENMKKKIFKCIRVDSPSCDKLVKEGWTERFQ